MTNIPIPILKDCPFCGGFANSAIRSYADYESQPMDEVLIYCTRCLAKQSDVDHAGADHLERAKEVIKRWNRRAQPQGFKP
jgi:Lar family restriction alleviation protein